MLFEGLRFFSSSGGKFILIVYALIETVQGNFAVFFCSVLMALLYKESRVIYPG